MAAKRMIMLVRSTAHVVDAARSVPFEFTERGDIRQGGLVAKPIPPMTPFEIDGDEAERILARGDGAIEIPPTVGDPEAWLRTNAKALGLGPRELAMISPPVRL